MGSFLKTEYLSDENKFFCNFCKSLQPAFMEHEFSSIGRFLIVQLKRFLNLNGSVTKDIRKVKCSPDISIPIQVEEEVMCPKKYRLIATINHSGNLDKGHYTAHTKLSTSNWLHCNDAAVVPCQTSAIDSFTIYILFFEAL